MFFLSEQNTSLTYIFRRAASFNHWCFCRQRAPPKESTKIWSVEGEVEHREQRHHVITPCCAVTRSRLGSSATGGCSGVIHVYLRDLTVLYNWLYKVILSYVIVIDTLQSSQHTLCNGHNSRSGEA